MKNLILLLFIGTAPFSYSITPEQVVAKMREKYKSLDQFEYSATYELFKGHSSKDVHSSYQGYLYRDGNQVYQKIDQTEFIYGKAFFLQISHSEKAVVLDQAPKLIHTEADQAVVWDACSEVKLEETEHYYILKFIYKATSQLPFSVTKMKVRKDNFLLEQLDFYYTIQENFSSDRRKPIMDQPHLKIRFTSFNEHPKKKENLFHFEKYIAQKDQFLYPSGPCMNYELIDNRVK